MSTIIRFPSGGGTLNKEYDSSTKTTTITGENFDDSSYIVVPYSDGYQYKFSNPIKISDFVSGVNGTVHKFGTLNVSGAKRKLSALPFCGEIYSLSIGDSGTDEDYMLQWVEVNDGGENYFIADRNLAKSSAAKLNYYFAGFDSINKSNSKLITIDYHEFELFMMTGVSKASSSYFSYDKDSEWGRWIGNSANLTGLSTDDSLWHWSSLESFCQQTDTAIKFDNVYAEMPIIGKSNFSTVSHTYNTSPYGWRPALRLIK